MERPIFPQALTTSFHTRVKNEHTSLFISTQTARGSKRNAAVINYAEDYFDEDENESASDTTQQQAHSNVLFNHQGKLALYSTSKLPLEPEKIARQPTYLVPISVNLEYQQARLADFFMWNLHETSITPEIFAEIMCQDLELPQSVQNQITSLINQQLEEHHQMANITLPSDLIMHVIVDISVNLDKRLYEDKFEWDLTSEMTPEQFAEIVVGDMGLDREFYPAIAHALHESLIKFKKDAIQGRLPPDIVNGAAYGKEAGWRFDPENLGKEWSPKVEVLSQWEIEKREIERERNIRRKKRETMRVEGDRGRRRGARRYDELAGTWVS